MFACSTWPPPGERLLVLSMYRGSKGAGKSDADQIASIFEIGNGPWELVPQTPGLIPASALEPGNSTDLEDHSLEERERA